MPRQPALFAVTFLLAAATACESGRHSSAGFRLPDSGDPEKGRVAFTKHECDRCHLVGDLKPDQDSSTALRVRLGGTVRREPTDGYLVTSIIHPSHRLAQYPRDKVSRAGESLMPHYAERMTVEELTDLVAFLHSQYKLMEPSPSYPY